MTQQTQRMNTLSNDLLMLPHGVAGRATPETTGGAQAMLGPLPIPPALPVTPFTSRFMPAGLALLAPHQLTSVFSNLMVNAVRHNPQGVRVDVAVELDDVSLRVAIEDNGTASGPSTCRASPSASIAPNQALQRHRVPARLAIVKHALNRHEARLEIQSTLGKGQPLHLSFSTQTGNIGICIELPTARE